MENKTKSAAEIKEPQYDVSFKQQQKQKPKIKNEEKTEKKWPIFSFPSIGTREQQQDEESSI